MKFTVLKSNLMNKLTPAMGTVSNKNTITSIEGVLIETFENNTIRISTYDMNKGVRATIEAVSIERDGKYIINAQRLYQTIRVLPEDEITIEVNEKLNCTISCGKASFSMYAMKGEDFPNLPDLVSDKGFEISSEKLRMMIGKVSHSIAELDNRPMLCGAFFRIREDFIEVVSCDSYTLSRCSMNCDISSIGVSEIDYSFIIPGHALGELSKNLADGNDEKVNFFISRKHAIVKKGDLTFFTRTIDSEYINYERIIPKENDIFVTVDKERLLDSLERANIIAEEKIKGSGRSYVKLTLEDQNLIITSSSVNGKVFDEMDCVHEGNDIEIGFNCRYLINSIKVAEGENIKITLKSANMAITIEPTEIDEEFNYFYMILPVRMNEQG
ncbi:MAG: DNA polymerase III subunit beta [Clostridia bacterium]|nr:DNA polymerase III subunit beta [Clostridia bacterium]MBO5316421.1 DNA polymerase III subunit beta [Clostridia bacterium]MBR3805885.1 DNA polymerase III subunit beta [Clostridia bacterium]